MENLNDAEFGSDKNQEEAPILVAQRYLNIFRQIHIFSKEKRDQFDDELLALPQNILDFYKRMPGGRLLFEHIEDVKTERGISFVKMNKDDFSYDTGGSSSDGSAAATTAGGGATTPVVGGNLVMDASFAETFAQSMAAAFKGIPAAAPVATGATSNVAVSADFGNAFDIIAEEIRTSRASLLDVLKETRNITDTVIASQVSISRVLEGLLASKNRDETDVANINNKIIASQASITKLLEGLYSTNTSKNEEISNYLNIDNKLQDFRNDLTQTIMGSLSGFADRASPVPGEGGSFSYDLEGRLSAFRSEIKADVNKSLSEIKKLLSDFVQNENNTHSSSANSNSITQDGSSLSDDGWTPVAQISSDSSIEKFTDVENQKPDSIQNFSPIDNHVVENHQSSENLEKKKKKKKKKKNNSNVAALAPVASIAATATDASTSITDNGDMSFIKDSLDDVGDIEEIQNNDPLSEIDIDTTVSVTDHDTESNTESDVTVADVNDDLSDILSDLEEIDPTDLDLSDGVSEENNMESQSAVQDEVSLDDLDLTSDIDLPDDNIEEPEIESDQNTGETSLPDDLDLTSDIDLPGDNIEEPAVEGDQNTGETSLPDDLDLASDIDLPDDDMNDISQDIPSDEVSFDNLDDLIDSSNSTGDEPIESVEETPEQPVFTEEQPIQDDLDSLSVDEVHTSSSPEVSDLAQQNFSSLDDLVHDDGLDFALPESSDTSNDITSENNEKTESDVSVSDDGLDFALPENPENTDYQVSDKEDLSSIQETATDFSQEQEDDASDDNGSSSASENSQTVHSSRYSAELDKIREALTSDNIDLASLDQPIALDDYSDDENVSDEDDEFSSAETGSSETGENSSDEDWEYEYVEDDGNEDTSANSEQTDSQNSGDWEWEYVDENGNPAPVEDAQSDEDWEWEYVEEDETQADKNPAEDDNNKE